MILKFTSDDRSIIYINSNHVRKFDYCEPVHGGATIVFAMEFSNGEKITYYGKTASRLHKLFMDAFEVVDLDIRTTDEEETAEDQQ